MTVVGASLSACGGARTIYAGDATVLVSGRTSDGAVALLEGSLAVVDGCLGITGADDTDVVVVWPHGTEVTDSEPPTIDLPDVGEVTVGDEVSVGGGEARSDDGRVGGVSIPPSCDDVDIWLAY